MVLASAAAVATFSITTVSTAVQLTDEALTSDSANTSLGNSGLTQTSTSISAAGTAAGSATEATIAGYATVSPGVSANRWVYTVDVYEAGNNTWSSSACYKVEVFGDGALMGTGYFKNATVVTGTVEGIVFKVDAGATGASSVASNWTSKVTATTGCA
jgi:hypothetical protein